MIQSTTSHVTHGGGSVMEGAFMVANGTGSLVFFEDVTADRSIRINSEVYTLCSPSAKCCKTNRTAFQSAGG